jgi:Fur family ferric uptake transcriptional regulator
MKRRNLEKKIMALLQVEHLLSASEMLIKLNELEQTYNKTSVYRAIDRLLEKNKLCQHNLPKKGVCYELRSQHHEHLQCERCGRVETLPCTFSHPSSISGFKISHHHLTYFGFCQACQ